MLGHPVIGIKAGMVILGDAYSESLLCSKFFFFFALKNFFTSKKKTIFADF
jgi:hypothetical protein